jgi:signal transduction histidine kinase
VAAASAFALDLSDGTTRTAGTPVAPDQLSWVRDTVRAHARAVFRPGWAYAVILGQTPARGHAVVYGVRYAEHDAPVAAYGWVTCTAAVAALLTRAAAAGRVTLPSPGAAIAGDSLVALQVLDATGEEMYRSPGEVASPFVAEMVLERLGGLRVRAALRPTAARGLVVEWPPRSRLPLLLGLLALTTGLAAIALIQLRREHELARLRADFTSSVSHELRTPLAQILLYAETLSLERVRTPTERRDAAETIVQETRRLMHLVDNVLHFARAEQGRGSNRLDPQPTRLAPALRAILTTFAPLADAHSVRLRTDFDEALVAVADAGALRQIVLNLLDNAVKYGPPGQVVTVGAARADGRVRLWVSDEGPGIPVSDRERIWHPFVRLTRDRGGLLGGPARGGSGIGLAVVRELVELQDGRAWVEPAPMTASGPPATAGRGPTAGARFVVELPDGDLASCRAS